MAKKAKWLEEGTTRDLLIMLGDILEGELDPKELNKAKKIVAEVIERTPEEGIEELSVEDAINELTVMFNEGIVKISNAYQAEVEAIGDAPIDEDDEDLDEDEDDEDEDDDEVDYNDLSQKALKELCRERGIKVTKSMKKADFIKALEADDDEE